MPLSSNSGSNIFGTSYFMFSVEGPTIIAEIDDVYVEPMSNNEGSTTVVVVAGSPAQPIMLTSSS
jgi:hypothetical protein